MLDQLNISQKKRLIVLIVKSVCELEISLLSDHVEYRIGGFFQLYILQISRIGIIFVKIATSNMFSLLTYDSLASIVHTYMWLSGQTRAASFRQNAFLKINFPGFSRNI